MKKLLTGLVALSLVFTIAMAWPKTSLAERENENHSSSSDKHGNQQANQNLRVSLIQQLISRLQDLLNSLGASSSSINRLPPGIQRAPGIEKRLENGKGLPPGLLKKLFGNDHGNHGGTTTDAAAPYITNVMVTAGTSTATITWQTTAAAQSGISYGSTTPITASSTSVSDSSLILSHQMVLTDLDANTTYYYVIVATDSANRSRTTGTLQFKTLAISVADTTAPLVTFVTTTNLTNNSARIIWVTNEAADGRAWVSTSTPDTTQAPQASSASLTYYHEFQITGLASSTSYNYAIISRDGSGNTSATATSTFSTTL